MRTAICCSGTGRSINHTIDNLKKNLFNCFDNKKIIIYLTKTDNIEFVKSYFDGISNIEFLIYEENPIDISQMIFVDNWPPSTKPDLEKGRQIYAQMIKSRYILAQKFKDIKDEYDCAIFSRLDVIYEKPVSSFVNKDELNDNTVIIPNFHHHSGINDRFCLSTKNGLIDYLSLYSHFKDMIDSNHVFCAEKTLLNYLKNRNKKILLKDIKFCRVRKNGVIHEGSFSRLR